jgi:hypothetical protein
MANDIQNKTASIYIDDQPAIDALNRLTPKVESYNKKIEEGTKKAEALSKSIKKALEAGKSPEAFQKKLDNVTASLEKNRQGLAKVTAQQKTLQQQIDNKTGPSLRQQEQLVRKLSNEYANMSAGTKDAAKKLEELGRASQVLDKMRDRVNQVKGSKGGDGGIFSGAFWGSLAGNVVAKATSAVAGFFSSTVSEALEAEEQTARFRATLDNIGRSDAFERLTKKADEMAKRFAYLDNDEIVGVFEKLIDYGKLTESQINDLTPVIINFAAKQRISLGEATDVVTKALEGSAKGLKQYGIELKGTETPAERLGVIMTQLKGKVNGAADAFQNSAAGAIKSTSQEFKNLAEEIGTNVMPIINKLMSFISGAIKGLRGITKAAEMEAEETARMTDVFVTRRAQKIEEQLKKGFINPKTGKPATREEFIKALQEEAEKSTGSVREIDLGVIAKLSTKTLGGGDPNSSADAEKEAENLAQKIKDDRKKLYEQLTKLDREYNNTYKSEFAEELEVALEKYNTLKDLAHGNKEDLKAIEEGYFMAVQRIRQKYTSLEMEETEKVQEARKRIALEADESIKRLEEKLNNKPNGVLAEQEKANREEVAKKELALLKAKGLKKLQLQEKQLDEEKQAELQSREHTESEIAVIEEKYRQQKMELEMQFYTQLFGQILTLAQDITELTSIDDKAETEKENRQLENRQKTNDKEKQAYKRMLDGKVITTQAYNAKIKALDDQYAAEAAAAKRKQWERQKKADTIAAVISGAQAVLAALQTKPFFPLGLIMAGVATAKSIKQINSIKNQPAPEFGKGGTMTGPSHNQGGMPVINPRTGRKEAEVEGGEVILSRNTVRNNPGLVGALLHSSMYQGGRSISRSRAYKTFDYSGISSSIHRVRRFANGGVFDTGLSGGAGGGERVVLPEGFEAMPDIMAALASRLQAPMKAFVVLSDIQAGADKLEQIKTDATFARQ